MESSYDATFAGRNVLITGGLGFIGSNLARRLVQLGASVTVVDSLTPTYGGNRFNVADIAGRLTIDFGDVRSESALQKLIVGRDYLFNLAGQTSHMDSMADPYTDLDINARAQMFILEACRKYNAGLKLVFASTRQIYGKPDYLPVDERHPLRPVDVNGINKMAGEGYHILYNNVYGIRACCLRLTNTYGPRMRVRDARQTFLGIWVRRLLEGQPIEVWGGEQKRDYTYVDDAVDAFLLAAASDAANGQIYNLGGDAVYTLAQSGERMIEANGGRGELLVREFPADRKRIDIGDYYADYFSIFHALGWRPRTSLLDGFRQTLDYFRPVLAHYVD